MVSHAEQLNVQAAAGAATYATERGKVCGVGRSLFERGFAHATAGSFSVRLGGRDGFLITLIDACLGFLVADSSRSRVSTGNKHASDTASMPILLPHQIYDLVPKAGCALHMHGTHLAANTRAGVSAVEDIVPPITPYFVIKVGHVPLTACQRPGAAAAVADVTRSIRASMERTCHCAP